MSIQIWPWEMKFVIARTRKVILNFVEFYEIEGSHWLSALKEKGKLIKKVIMSRTRTDTSNGPMIDSRQADDKWIEQTIKHIESGYYPHEGRRDGRNNRTGY